jgi:stage VI sporulation protein D
MALQDGLLSFAIKETIFLSPDKAGIGELQELELVPDVEVLENQSYVSITGCLQLYGKYEPIRDTAETNSGGTETLVEAMTFSPFRPENTDGPFYGWEEQIGHRIPLNITIPLDRIAEIGDIYAVVDSFDYKLESPHQLLIEAELKIAGIVIGEQPQTAQHQPDSPASPEYGQTEPGRQVEAWDFAYAVNDQPQAMADPASLDEIEQKLYELEREMDRQAQPVNYESADSAALYDVPALSVSTGQAFGDQRFGEVSEEEEPVTQATFSEQAEAVEQESPWETQSVSYGTQSAEYESSSVSFETESAFT